MPYCIMKAEKPKTKLMMRTMPMFVVVSFIRLFNSGTQLLEGGPIVMDCVK